MAQRPVFSVALRAPYSLIYRLNFTFNSGFSNAQKQKNIAALHEEFGKTVPGKEGKKITEISSKSTDPETVKLSAFKLMKYVPSLGKSVPVECVYQAGKVFAKGGPYTDLLEASPKDAKIPATLAPMVPVTPITVTVRMFRMLSPHSCRSRRV